MFNVEQRDALRERLLRLAEEDERVVAGTLARFDDAHVGSLDPGALRAALAASTRALMREGVEARLAHADAVSERLAEFADTGADCIRPCAVSGDR